MVKDSLRRKRCLKQDFVERNAQSQLEKKKMLIIRFSKKDAQTNCSRKRCQKPTLIVSVRSRGSGNHPSNSCSIV
jgi:hypothetical protein